MNFIITIVFVVCILIIFLSMRIQSLRKREIKRQTNLDEHLQMLNKGIEKLNQQNLELVNDTGVHPQRKSMRDLWGFPPLKNEVLEEIRADNINLDWDYIVHIHEGTEQYLGPSYFHSLTERFSKIQNVEACKQEDRELFLIRTKTLSIDSLQEAIWQEFLIVAEESYNKDNRP